MYESDANEEQVKRYAINRHIYDHMEYWMEITERTAEEAVAEVKLERARLEKNADNWFKYEEWVDKYLAHQSTSRGH